MALTNSEKQKAYRERKRKGIIADNRNHPPLNNAERQRYYRERCPGIDKMRRDIIKREVLEHYGNGQCACVKCGFDDIRALSLDHIHGRVFNENTLKKKGEKVPPASQIYRTLQKQDYPDGYQTLCMNCQWIKRYENSELIRK